MELTLPEMLSAVVESGIVRRKQGWEDRLAACIDRMLLENKPMDWAINNCFLQTMEALSAMCGSDVLTAETLSKLPKTKAKWFRFLRMGESLFAEGAKKTNEEITAQFFLDIGLIFIEQPAEVCRGDIFVIHTEVGVCCAVALAWDQLVIFCEERAVVSSIKGLDIRARYRVI